MCLLMLFSSVLPAAGSRRRGSAPLGLGAPRTGRTCLCDTKVGKNSGLVKGRGAKNRQSPAPGFCAARQPSRPDGQGDRIFSQGGRTNGAGRVSARLRTERAEAEAPGHSAPRQVARQAVQIEAVGMADGPVEAVVTQLESSTFGRGNHEGTVGRGGDVASVSGFMAEAAFRADGAPDVRGRPRRDVGQAQCAVGWAEVEIAARVVPIVAESVVEDDVAASVDKGVHVGQGFGESGRSRGGIVRVTTVSPLRRRRGVALARTKEQFGSWGACHLNRARRAAGTGWRSSRMKMPWGSTQRRRTV